MKIEKETLNSVIGEVLIKEKYKFLPTGLVAEIITDAFEELEK